MITLKNSVEHDKIQRAVRGHGPLNYLETLDSATYLNKIERAFQISSEVIEGELKVRLELVRVEQHPEFCFTLSREITC